MSSYSDFEELIKQAQGGIVEPPKPVTYEKIDYSQYVIQFGGDEFKYIDARILSTKPDQYFHGGLARIYKHYYYDNTVKPAKSVTYDCLKNYGRKDCPLCELQRNDFFAMMKECNNVVKAVDPFIAQSNSKEPDVFAWVYVTGASPNMQQYVGGVWLVQAKGEINTLIKNHSDPEWCTKAGEPYVNFINPASSATIRMSYDGTMNPKTQAYSRSKVLVETLNTPMLTLPDGTIDQKGIMDIMSRIPSEYSTNSARFFSWRVAGNENTPLSLLQSYTAFSANQPKYRYRSVHPLMAEANKDANQIPSNAPVGESYNDFGNQPQEKSYDTPQSPAHQQPQSTPQSTAPSYDDFDDDIPF